MTLGRCPLSIFCFRGTPPRKAYQLLTQVSRLKVAGTVALAVQGSWHWKRSNFKGKEFQSIMLWQ